MILLELEQYIDILDELHIELQWNLLLSEKNFE
jgi:hypothetical protein